MKIRFDILFPNGTSDAFEGATGTGWPGSSKDSLVKIMEFPSRPMLGETLNFYDKLAPCNAFKVTDVMHGINEEKNAIELVVCAESEENEEPEGLVTCARSYIEHGWGE